MLVGMLVCHISTLGGKAVSVDIRLCSWCHWECLVYLCLLSKHPVIGLHITSWPEPVSVL